MGRKYHPENCRRECPVQLRERHKINLAGSRKPCVFIRAWTENIIILLYGSENLTEGTSNIF
jgi:hypothetical protein